MKTIDELLAEGVTGKRVFVRADLNVPLSGTTITDDGRIRAVQPTVEKLAAAGARVIVASHLGRPKGAPDPAFSLAPAAARLGELIGADVAFATDTVGESARATVAALTDGKVAVIENLRFNPGETSKDDAERGAFADQLAELADVYVGDGFGAVHRKHASVFDLPARLPHAAGDLIATEVGVLKKLTEDVARPYAVVLGGSKVSDKLGVIDHLLERADRILIGGGMAYTFLKAQGHEVGSSLLQEDQIPAVLEYLKRAEEKGVEFVLPVDVVVSEQFPDLKTKAPSRHTTVPADAIPAGVMGLDNGPETNKLYASKLADAVTVFWNGPMGVFEHPDYAEGTRAVAQALVDSEGFSVVGGGDSAAAVRILGFDENAFGHISTGGGASLEYLEGKTLPGLAALED
ncbi:phosphoglycerate kinase [Streptomyces sp. NBC_01724]|jgi:phosphoglycerate kinase|uniref:Phosphoglycerate kinase n=1 Tax=Streptomyces sp. 900116325 TaxID=3154295 RepID=A0ABV2U3D1_9ACTN|nr:MULTISPECIES: phosphoglycerate kinase [unclassified Streptomyces]WSF87413.1 phosphoglycerate kinase [Streptomyces sp. NBC_01744]WTC82579.1 phosphoglycerate kinase [Streptomyces sp. NBC_01653]WTD32807.1 phosphoglycerate kinase [Streptomyces sp. NBC_01643]WTD88287.1 phosphoglycerate kinase [Streptomyces sp. NBC_01637]WTE59182.1 phosphoglycerate kinase [Streptomyces sp. NBC_01617]WTI86691.1 phosphoglycerate kinase [Streptomyces sp. NBC_00724]